uniref:Uncharacterized protein n=1 Tax=Biomphalaria glabrata TaxID=6526 RepID=A0A2C9KZG5_BIOGL
MSETHGRKAKSGIPLLKKIPGNVLLEPTLTSQSTGTTASSTSTTAASRPTSTRDLNSREESAEIISSDADSAQTQTYVQPTKSKTQAEKKANTRTLVTKTNKNVKNSNSNEIWQDERTETVSRNLQAITNTEYERRRQEMALNIKLLEDELAKMNGLLEKRKKVMDEAQEEARKQLESMEKTIVDQQSLLIKHGVDPVTGEQVVLTGSDGQGKSGNIFTKKKVQEIREKLRDMNETTRVYLEEIEQTLSDIDNLEKASERARPTSPETLKMLQELADSDEFRQLEENSQVNSQAPEVDLNTGSLEDYTKEKFGPHVFLTNSDREEDNENNFASSDIEIV